MADEISELMKIEMEGTVYLVKGGIEAVKMLARFLKWSYEHALKSSLKNERSMAGIDKLSKLQTDGKGQSVVLNVPKEYYNELIAAATKKGLHFATLIDFDKTDGVIPLYIPAGEVPIYTALNAIVQQKALDAQNKDISDTEKELVEAKKQFDAAPEGSTEKEEAARKIALLNEKLEEQNKDAADIETNMQNSTMSLEEYLAEAKHSEFAKDPEKAFAELEKGVEISKDFTVEEAFKTIRDPKNIPSAGKSYIVPMKGGATITRIYSTDSATNTCSSSFEVKTKDGTILTLTDNPHVKPDGKSIFAKEDVTKFLKAAGIDSKTFRVDFNQTTHEAYKKFHNNVEIPSETKVLESSPTVAQILKEESAEKTIIIKFNSLNSGKDKDGKLKIPYVLVDKEKDEATLCLEEGKIELPKAALIHLQKSDNFASDGIVNVTINKNDVFSLKKENGESVNITGKEIKELANKSLSKGKAQTATATATKNVVRKS